jgi:hypothetical protein
MDEKDKPLEHSKPLKKPGNKAKRHSARRLRTVDLDYLDRQAKTVLHREICYLLDMSHVGKLSKDDSVALVSYLKAIKDLKKAADDDLASLSDEELAKVAKDTT